jgi:hypothetical protein
MQLIQILLPLYDNQGALLERALFDQVRVRLTEQFGGVTTYMRSPARGLWKDDAGAVVRDDIVIYEVMVDQLDRSWWDAYRQQLRHDFAQDEIVIRALPMERL